MGQRREAEKNTDNNERFENKREEHTCSFVPCQQQEKDEIMSGFFGLGSNGSDRGERGSTSVADGILGVGFGWGSLGIGFGWSHWASGWTWTEGGLFGGRAGGRWVGVDEERER
ncbi:hypothetical protein HAX54_028532, partial [Datura stramonium]|nr:hypothetical protein [Datura stramonium]